MHRSCLRPVPMTNSLPPGAPKLPVLWRYEVRVVDAQCWVTVVTDRGARVASIGVPVADATAAALEVAATQAHDLATTPTTA